MNIAVSSGKGGTGKTFAATNWPRYWPAGERRSLIWIVTWKLPTGIFF